LTPNIVFSYSQSTGIVFPRPFAIPTKEGEPILKSVTIYDEVAYPGYPYPLTHPDHLATLARLHGMKPAPPNCCRVLELGCGDGANLIPMALVAPDSQFLGVDLAASPILQGRKLISQLGLGNIQLEDVDLMDFSTKTQPFDYIIAHGLYSWVPPFVQKRVLEIVEYLLAPEGVAFISYNTMPGGHIRMMLREMMLFHCQRFELPDEKIQQARSLIQLIAGAQNQPNRYGVLVQEEWGKDISDRHPRALFHDELGECNSNLYFHEFMTRAADYHLQFLCEADYGEMQPRNIKPQIGELLRDLGDDIIAKEQYLDFMRGRRFRQTLLCHAAVQVDRSMYAERVKELLIASNARPESALSRAALDSEVQFRGSKDGSITSSHPLLTAALACLIDHWPLAMAFETLWGEAREQLRLWGSPASDPQVEHRMALAEALLMCYGAGVIELRSWAPPLTPKPGRYPLASPFARMQSRNGDIVTTLLHTPIEMRDALSKKLLQLLDGARDRPMIVNALEQAILSGEVDLMAGEERRHNAEEIVRILNAGIESNLEELACLGLLIS
jgi:methyltransferase-like protein